jgi:ATP-binding cassette subfamily B protein RaxB
MTIHLAKAAGPLQVGVTSPEPAAAPARDAGLTALAAEDTKSAEAARRHHDRSADGKDGYPKHVGGWKDAENDGCQPRKNDCQPRKDYCDTKPSDCCEGDTYRNPGEALAKIDFSR